MNKILIIGQAPPAVKQSLPYDTTMLYDWFEEIGISKIDAVNIFLFDAVYDKFPGSSSSGGHLKPTESQMNDYWDRSLKDKVENAESILVLGSCARDFLQTKNIQKKMEFIIHPSKRNYSLYIRTKLQILNKLSNLINNGNTGNKSEYSTQDIQKGY